jgi:hypothetical protein
MSHITIAKLTAALVVISAILAPAAVARPVESALGPESGIQSQAGAGSPPAVDSGPTATVSGFDWGDAAIGAAGMLVALSVGVAGVTTVRRSRGRTGPVLTG